VVRYSFIAVDLHHILLAGLPAHRQLPYARARIVDAGQGGIRSVAGTAPCSSARVLGVHGR
jgi:hypothetical protein